MIDYARVHHHGIVVAEMAAAREAYGAALGLEWAPTRRFDPLPFWPPRDGTHALVVEATYSTDPVHRIELVQGSGAFYAPDRRPDARHVGLFVDDLPAECRRLIGLGWIVQGANAAPEAGYGVLAYLTPPDETLMVELVCSTLADDLAAWIGGRPGRPDRR